jgi:hypothetical protein
LVLKPISAFSIMLLCYRCSMPGRWWTETNFVRRSGWVTGATLLHASEGVFFLGISLYLWLLTFSAEIKHGAEAADTVHGLKIAAGVLTLPGILVIIGAYGLWKSKLWAWWFALMVDVGWSSVLLYSLIDDGWANLDVAVLALFAISTFLMLFLALPSPRKYYWDSR